MPYTDCGKVLADNSGLILTELQTLNQAIADLYGTVEEIAFSIDTAFCWYNGDDAYSPFWFNNGENGRRSVFWQGSAPNIISIQDSLDQFNLEVNWSQGDLLFSF